MQVQAYNQYSIRKYEELTYAVQEVRMALDSAEYLLSKLRGDRVIYLNAYTTITKKELVKKLTDIYDALGVLELDMKKWEKELLSRTWRV